MSNDTVTDMDLESYIDNQLDNRGRMRVESFLAHHPAIAARVMSDLAIRRALKLGTQFDATPPTARSHEAGRKLERGLSNRRGWNVLRRVAAAGILVTAGWFIHGQIGATAVNASAKPPAYVEEALRAHQVTQVREHMASQPQVMSYDPNDIRSATAIVLPTLPSSWRVIDVQVYPSQFGPSVELSLKDDDGQGLSLFAVRPGSFAVAPLRMERLADIDAAYWQIGDVAYALVSSSSNSDLADEAASLINTLY
jgi:anti-sigma factor RsiW